jgi:putative DNA primase/helicase
MTNQRKKIDWSSSYINDEWVGLACLYLVDDEEGRLTVGVPPSRKGDYSGVVIPYFWPGDLSKRNERLRRHVPDYEQDGEQLKEKRKYLGAPGWRNFAYFPPKTDPSWLQDVTVPVYIVEGEKKAIALARYFLELRQEKVLIIALAGVWSWRGVIGTIRDSNGHRMHDIKGIIADLHKVEWRARHVRILFDTNATTNDMINNARRALSKWIMQQGGLPALLNLPQTDGMNGIDDFLGAQNFGPDWFSKFIEDSHNEGTNVQLVPGFPLSDFGNAERFIAKNGHNVRWYDDGKRWYVWDDRRWFADDVLTVQRWAKETIRAIPSVEGHVVEEVHSGITDMHSYARKCETNDKLHAMLNIAKAEQGVPMRIADFDTNIYLLNCLNGTLDLKLLSLREHDRLDLITKITPIPYDEHATCERWEQFLREIFDNDEEMIDFMQRAIGYSLTGDITAQYMFVLWGQGANGKSKIIDTIRKLTGDFGYHSPIDTFMMRPTPASNSNDLAALRGARLVTASETNEGARLNEGLIKQCTGGEPITARFLNKEYFTFPPHFKLWFSVNHKPTISGSDYALWRRVLLIPFTVQFKVGDPRRDDYLQDKLDAELPGILAWAVRGCQKWMSSGFVIPDKVRMATDEYQLESDSIGTWLVECCDLGPDLTATSGELYQSYKDWSARNGLRAKSTTLFGRTLKAKGFGSKHEVFGTLRSGLALHRP